MKGLAAIFGVRLGLILLMVLAIAEPITAQDTPIGPRWWPSQWGPDDQRGAINRITPEKVMEAVKLIKEGKIYELGRTYEPGMPLFGSRHYSLTIVSSPSGGPLGENQLVWHDEMFSGEIGQIGTQFDGLGHIGVRVGGEDYFYNGFKRSDFSKAYGLEKLGVENVGVFFTRGILIDVAAYKGVERLEIGYIITPEDLQGALKKQGVSIRGGDAIFFHTGHGAFWMKDNAKYNEGEPGIGLAAARWLIDQKIVLTGGDTWSVEAVPGDNPNRPFEVHQWLILKNGIYNLENLNLDELAQDKVYEFAFIFTPLKLKGATGSPGNPIAVR
ncbi:cyclase family protein [Acidobacteria bacterium AH-259-A15]|nr:cyclase family protein [Acidobacteria bacterium AH-259-A15]